MYIIYPLYLELLIINTLSKWTAAYAAALRKAFKGLGPIPEPYVKSISSTTQHVMNPSCYPDMTGVSHLLHITYGYHIIGPVSRATALLRPTYLAPKLCFPTPC
jgi:hypothetical protein